MLTAHACCGVLERKHGEAVMYMGEGTRFPAGKGRSFKYEKREN